MSNEHDNARVAKEPGASAGRVLQMYDTESHPKATLIRFDHLVRLLRDYYTCAGWKLDEDAGAKARVYFASQAKGKPVKVEDFCDLVLPFFKECEQGLGKMLTDDSGVMLSMLVAGAHRVRTRQIPISGGDTFLRLVPKTGPQ